MKRLTFLSIIVSVAATRTLAQSANQAAVDTLTKEVAKAVFAGIKQPKAQEIHTQLLNCGDGCDPQQIIRAVGSWDQVGAKMQELSELKGTQAFQAMAPGEANAAIRKQLTRFYTTHRAEKPYSVPLSPTVQEQILAKIDNLLPPDEAPGVTPTATASPTATQPVSDEETEVSDTALQISKLEIQVRKEQEKQFWMILVSALAGLLGGAAAVYFLLYRKAQAEAVRLRNDNSQLSRSLDAARRPKPTNEPRQSQQDAGQQDANRQKAKAYDALLAELGPNVNPLEAIRQLKSPKTVVSKPGTRSGEPSIETESSLESALVQSQVPPAPIQPSPEPLPTPVRSEVFYFPPPDPSGQFDLTQKSDMLSPESAYRFSVSADNPAVAAFRFEADPGRVARFITYRNYMIEPACESENSYTPAHTRITMRRDGEAVLENGGWRVKTKALIRYE
ncbi:hypothetical protein [Spirosoma koreense]